MDRLSFYKSIFEREQNRRSELNNAINLPVTMITGLVALFYFLTKKIETDNHSCMNIIAMIGLLLGFIAFLVCIWFLAASFNNFVGGFNYMELPKTKELFEYDKQIEKYNSTVESEKKQNFDEYLLGKYVEYSDNFVEINDKRSKNLYYAKSLLVVVLGIELIAAIFITIHNIF